MSIPVPREMLDTYNIPGPRYTSYPTVPAWTGDFTDHDFQSALKSLAASADDPLSIYFHLPFCQGKCHYCGCNSMALTDCSAIDVYIDHVEQELEMVTNILGKGRPVVQMHWGGGTPNLMDEAQLRRVTGLMQSAFRFDSQSECSIEADPRTGSRQQVALLKELGFNRISFGVQDFEPAVQEAIGRIQPLEVTRDLIDASREVGFHSVNADLVYGLPHQTAETFEKTMDTVLDFEPDRVACFSYAHVPWVKPNQKKLDATKLPDAHGKFELFRIAIDRLEGAGYTWIGLDHFAKNNDELSAALRERRLHRNFMGYTTRPELNMLALGMSGISDLKNCFAQNVADLDDYQTTVAQGKLPIVRGHNLTSDDQLRREAILNLMCNLELPFALSIPRFGKPLDELLPDAIARLEKYVETGFIEKSDQGIVVTPLGRYFIRNLCMELDAYLDGTGDKPLFSKTV